MVNHTKLIAALSSTSLRHNTIRWISAYLKGRMARCRYNYAVSSMCHTRTGVPQGSSISPVLFNHFVSSYPQDNHLTLAYADDFTDSITNSNYEIAATGLTNQATRVSEWAAERGLALSAPKSTVTLFTSHRAEVNHHPQVNLNGSTLPLQRNPCILGVVFDPLLTFGKHADSLYTRAGPRMNILKALAGTTWGQQAETMIITYKSQFRSILHYAVPVWFPNVVRSNIEQL